MNAHHHSLIQFLISLPKRELVFIIDTQATNQKQAPHKNTMMLVQRSSVTGLVSRE
jgi:hypothetical protein